MENKVVVADQKTADAFKALGIDAVVKGASTENTDSNEEITLLKGQVDTLSKAVTDKDAEIETLKKGATSTDADVLTKAHVETLLNASALISKSVLDSVSGLVGAIEVLQKSTAEKLEAIEAEIETIGTASAGRRTASAGTGVIKKAFETDEKTGKKVLSKSQHAKAIIELMDGLAENKETSELYSDAVVRFETSRQITKGIVEDLSLNHEITIVE